jgi:hypothetical protein
VDCWQDLRNARLVLVVCRPGLKLRPYFFARSERRWLSIRTQAQTNAARIMPMPYAAKMPIPFDGVRSISVQPVSCSLRCQALLANHAQIKLLSKHAKPIETAVTGLFHFTFT